MFGEHVAAFGREAFDAAFSRDAASATEQFQGLRFPQVDAGLHAEFQAASEQAAQQLFVRQEDLVDEIDVFDALPGKRVDFLQNEVRRPAAICVAEILLGAKRAMVRAAARSFDFRARSDRLGIEAMMMMAVPTNDLAGPGRRELTDKSRGSGPSDYPGGAAFDEASTGNIAFTAGKLQEDLFAFSHDHKVDAELPQHRPRRRRSVRTDGDQETRMAVQGARQFLRYGEFRRRAAPEQIRRRRRDHGHVGTKVFQLGDYVARAEIVQMRIDEQRPVLTVLKELVGDPEFERQVRRPASEIYAAVVAPIGIDERYFHATFRRVGGAAPNRSCSQFSSVRRPSCSRTPGRQPIAAERAPVSDTYQG